jgi:crossover junction endodeoxyribonuclease RusA
LEGEGQGGEPRGPSGRSFRDRAAVPRTGDIDNILKPTLDALIRHVYLNDGQVERIVAQKFKPDDVFPFTAPSPVLAEALQSVRLVVYIRLSDDPFEDLT